MSTRSLAEGLSPKDLPLRNGHLRNLAGLFPSNHALPALKDLLADHLPVTGNQRDDQSVFELLGKVAEMMGRTDLVQEFMQRAQATVPKLAAPPPPPPTPVPPLSFNFSRPCLSV